MSLERLVFRATNESVARRAQLVFIDHALATWVRRPRWWRRKWTVIGVGTAEQKSKALVALTRELWPTFRPVP